MFENININMRMNTQGYGQWFNATRRMNQTLSNINKDSNRTAEGIGRLTSSFKGLNQVIGIGQLAMIGNVFAKSIQSAMDMTETVNLFSVAMGDTAVATDNTVQEMSRLYGLDATNLQNAVGTFSLLARSMGFNTSQSSELSTNMAKLAVDLASLTNVPINQAMADLKSGLVGQSETVYKYGMDVTEAGLKAEAMRQGITKSVRDMNQGEKMALRYSVMIHSTGLAQGDFAKTINSPANQMKILYERFITLGRAIGGAFLPMLGAVLPYLNAFVMILTDVANAIAKFMGFVAPKSVNTKGTAIGGMGDDAEGTAKSLDKATASAKKLQQVTMGFDELNTITPPTDPSGGNGNGAGGSGSILDGINLEGYDNKMSGIVSKADEIKQKIIDALTIHDGNIFNELIKSFHYMEQQAQPIIDNMKGGLSWLYNNVLLPIGNWTISTLIPVTFYTIGNALIFINACIETMKPLWQWLWDFVILPLGVAVGDALVQGLISLGDVLLKLSDWITNNKTVVQDMTIIVIGFMGAFKVMKLLEFTEKAGACTVAIKGMGGALKLAGDMGAFFQLVTEFGLIKTLTDLYPVAMKVATVFTGIGLTIGGLIILYKGISEVLTESNPTWKSFGEVVLGVSLIMAGMFLLFGGIPALITGAVLVLGVAGAYLYKYWDDIKAYIKETWDNIKLYFSGLWSDIYTGVTVDLPKIFDEVVKWISDIPNKIAYWLGFALGSFVKWVADSYVYLDKEIPKVVDSIANWFKSLPTKIYDFIVGVKSKIEDWAKNCVTWVTTEVPKITGSITSYFKALPSDIYNAIVGFASTLSNIGKFILDGIFKGFVGMGSMIADWCGSFVKGFKDALGIHSPSRVMEDEVGTYMGLGIAKGIDGTRTDIVDSATSISDDVQGAFDSITYNPKIANLTPSDAFKNMNFGTSTVNANYNGTASITADSTDLASSIYNAVASAISTLDLSGQVIENVLNLDGEKIYTNQQKITRGRGVDFGMGVFAR